MKPSHIQAIRKASDEINDLFARAMHIPSPSEIDEMVAQFRRSLELKATAAQAMYFEETPEAKHLLEVK